MSEATDHKKVQDLTVKKMELAQKVRELRGGDRQDQFRFEQGWS